MQAVVPSRWEVRLLLVVPEQVLVEQPLAPSVVHCVVCLSVAAAVVQLLIVLLMVSSRLLLLLLLLLFLVLLQPFVLLYAQQ